MRKVGITFFILFTFLYLFGANLKNVLKEYKKERKATIKKLSKEFDPQFMDLYAKFNRSKRSFINEILRKYPDLKNIKDKKERRRAVRKKAVEFRKENNQYFLRYLKDRMNLDFYLMKKNPKLKELFNEIKDSGIYKKWFY